MYKTFNTHDQRSTVQYKKINPCPSGHTSKENIYHPHYSKPKSGYKDTDSTKWLNNVVSSLKKY